MTQKELGYIELEWTCKRCNTINPGMVKVCANCGAPMSQEDKFELPDQQELIADKNKLEEAKKGPSIECPYCHTFNPAGTINCLQCGGDIQQGLQRQVGEVLGAHTTAPAPDQRCPSCGQMVPANAQRCPHCGGSLVVGEKAPTAPAQVKKTPLWLIAAGAVLVVLCIGSVIALIVLSSRTSDVTASVESRQWQRSIDVLAQQPVEKSSWEEDVPAQAQDVSCQDKYRETSDNPAPKSTEMCGTPYVVDQGSGAGKVVQDCVYQVYASYCSYSVLDWVVVNSLMSQGEDGNPTWPALILQAGQQEGDHHETYQVTFSSNSETYSYAPSDATEYNQFQPGTEWVLSINAFGQIKELQSK